MSPTVTLSSGYEVSYPCYAATCGALEILCEYHPEAALPLVEKCHNILNERCPQSKSILRVYTQVDSKVGQETGLKAAVNRFRRTGLYSQGIDLRRFEPACWPTFESTWVYHLIDDKEQVAPDIQAIAKP